MAQRLNVDENWILGLSAYESGYLDSHNVSLNNPFGITDAGGNNLRFTSYEEAAAYWESHYGDTVRNATSAEDFLNKLGHTPKGAYNSVNPAWKSGVLGVIDSVGPRKELWLSRGRN